MTLLQNRPLFQAICPGSLWARDNRWLLSRVQRLAGLARGQRSFVPVGDTNRDKREAFYPGWWIQPGQKATRAFCPGWRHQPGQKAPPFCPGWCLQPGQKPLHGLTLIDIRLFIFTAPLSPSLIFLLPSAASSPSELISSPPALTPPAPSSLRCAPPRRGQGLASRRTGAGGGRPAAARAQAAAHAGRRAAAAAGRWGWRGRVQAGGRAALDGCRPAAVAQTGSSSLGPTSSRRPPRDDQTGSSSRPDRRGLGPDEPLPQRVAKRRGRTPAAVGRREQGRRRTAGSVVDFLCL